MVGGHGDTLFLRALLASVLILLAGSEGRAADPFPVHATDSCDTSTWVVPFAQGDATLNAFAQARLDAVVAAWRLDGGPVLASGRVDGLEEHRYPGLAQRRLQALSDALVRRGLPARALWVRDDGGRNGFVDNQPGVAEPQNRIVLAMLPLGGGHCARALAAARADWLRRNCLTDAPKGGRPACDAALLRLDQ